MNSILSLCAPKYALSQFSYKAFKVCLSSVLWVICGFNVYRMSGGNHSNIIRFNAHSNMNAWSKAGLDVHTDIGVDSKTWIFVYSGKKKWIKTAQPLIILSQSNSITMILPPKVVHQGVMQNWPLHLILGDVLEGQVQKTLGPIPSTTMPVLPVHHA